jgi:hypothetical protein
VAGCSGTVTGHQRLVLRARFTSRIGTGLTGCFAIEKKSHFERGKRFI